MGYKCIVCGVTGSPNSQKAALHAARLAQKDNAKLVYVYVVDASFVGRSLMAEMSQTYMEDSLEKLGKHILDYAEELAGPLGVAPKKVVKRGKVLTVLREVAVEEKADLLILGHEERTVVERALFKGDVERHSDALKKETGAEVLIVQ